MDWFDIQNLKYYFLELSHFLQNRLGKSWSEKTAVFRKCILFENPYLPFLKLKFILVNFQLKIKVCTEFGQHHPKIFFSIYSQYQIFKIFKHFQQDLSKQGVFITADELLRDNSGGGGGMERGK